MQVQSSAVVIQSQHQFQRQHSMRPIPSPESSVPTQTTNIIAKPESLDNENSPLDPQLLTIKRILEAFLGHEIFLSGSIEKAKSESENIETVEHGNVEQDSMEASPPLQQWVHLSLNEQEQSQFAIRAHIRLASGEQRTIVIEETMARSLSLDLKTTAIEAAQIIDPLVINFDGPVRLDSEKVQFDVNADGKKDSIASFASHSAYLAFDKNGDGSINDGSELFGVLTGNGFAELAVFDDDGNGFIDQHDKIYSQLQLFDPSKSTTRLLAASEVEAIYLGSVATPFTLASKSGEELGFVRSSGFYLSNTGAGTVQQIDLVV